MGDEEDPLIQALPPATDYLTYLTLVEYQLTPARLPLLHKILQDEILTINIGWDLVQILLPMLPESQECLQDVARLGNPREVILRVSDALMKLPSVDDRDDVESELSYESDTHDPGTLGDSAAVDDSESEAGLPHNLPRPVQQFNSLVSMLSILHARIKTKRPSQFLATSLQAVLEAYTSMPTTETTAAFLDFFGEVSGRKRPALPPRHMSEKSVPRTADSSAPDPEAEAQTDSPSTFGEQDVVNRLLQFGLIELLKVYLLNVANEHPPGMHWVVRLQEKLHPELKLPSSLSPTERFTREKRLKERDRTIGKITALARDLALDSEELISIVKREPDGSDPPLDFDELPELASEIPLERHGCLLLLAARHATTVLFSPGHKLSEIPIYPDLAAIFQNFLEGHESYDAACASEPQPLIDSLLTLVATAMHQKQIEKADKKEHYEKFVMALTACSLAPSFREYSLIGGIPAAVYLHSSTSETGRFQFLRRALQDSSARASAVGWVKDELLSGSGSDPSILFDHPHFTVLFRDLFSPVKYSLDDVPSIIETWINFAQNGPSLYLAQLNLYYLIVRSDELRRRLLLLKDQHQYFRDQFLGPLKTLAYRLYDDPIIEARVEKELGEGPTEMGKSFAGLVLHTISQIEDVLEETLEASGVELRAESVEEMAKVKLIGEAHE